MHYWESFSWGCNFVSQGTLNEASFSFEILIVEVSIVGILVEACFSWDYNILEAKPSNFMDILKEASFAKAFLEKALTNQDTFIGGIIQDWFIRNFNIILREPQGFRLLDTISFNTEEDIKEVNL